MFKRLCDRFCFAHRSLASEWGAVDQKSFADVEHFAILVNDDLHLSFKRLDRVRSDKGYQGTAVVCAVRFAPIAGHVPDRAAIKYLVQLRDIEMWLAPIAGTRVLIPHRVSIPTLFGSAILEATQFETEAQAVPPTRAANPSERPARGS